jgi:hypothetical protein
VKPDCRWKRSVKKKIGVLCGTEKNQEWLLPWWWSRYREYNDFPVTFFDFGMSDEMKAWCARKGELCSANLEPPLICSRSDIDPVLAKEWERLYGSTVWSSRPIWFKKPFAFLNSSYEKTVWIDLDCEVLGPLDFLFSHSESLALVREYSRQHLSRNDPNVCYNGGVIVFQHGISIIEKWAEDAMVKNDRFGGDDLLLSYLIHKFQWSVAELPEIYNWRIAQGLNLNAVIVHWLGSWGKAYIRKYGGIKPLLNSFNSLPGGNADEVFRNLEEKP